VLKGAVIPALLSRSGGGDSRDVNRARSSTCRHRSLPPPALIVVAFVTTRGVGRFVGTSAGSLVPVGVATMLIGFFVLVTRRRPVFQIVGLLMVDNGIALVASSPRRGPFLIELGSPSTSSWV